MVKELKKVEINNLPVYTLIMKGEDLSDTMLRVSEYKECPKHGGKIFNRFEYDVWFDEEHDDVYHNIVMGTNLPASSFKEFYEAFVNQEKEYAITSKESYLFEWLKSEKLIKIDGSKLTILKEFYIIGVNDDFISSGYFEDEENGLEGILSHEYAHALYYLDKNYKKLVNKVWESISDDYRQNVIAELTDGLAYNEATYIDEFNAYTVENANFDGDGNFPIPLTESESASVEEMKAYYTNVISELL